MTVAFPPVANPLLLNLPRELTGVRIVARPYRDGEGASVAEAVAESRDRLLAAGMPWVKEWDEPDQGAIFVRRCQAKWAARDELILGLWERSTGAYLGSSGLHRIDLTLLVVPVSYSVLEDIKGWWSKRRHASPAPAATGD